MARGREPETPHYYRVPERFRHLPEGQQYLEASRRFKSAFGTPEIYVAYDRVKETLAAFDAVTGEPPIEPISEKVMRKVQLDFPPGEVEQVCELLVRHLGRSYYPVDKRDADIAPQCEWLRLQTLVRAGGKIDFLERLIQAALGDTRDMLAYGFQSELYTAAEHGDIQAVHSLLERGADPENEFGPVYTTPLMVAAGAGHLAVVRLLLEKGAEVDRIAGVGADTALMFAADPSPSICEKINVAPNEAIVRLLLEYGAAPDLKTSSARVWPPRGGVTALMLAAKDPNPGSVRALLAAGADHARADHERWTPLIYAAKEGSAATVEALLVAGADPGSKERRGRTPLDIAQRRLRAQKGLATGTVGRSDLERMVALLASA